MKSTFIKRNSFWLALSLVLALFSAIGAAVVQTDGGAVTVKDLKWETSAGRSLNALLFKPDDATNENPAPAIVVTHGWWNNREMQDANYVELARRGYVVISIDMYGHGNSDPLPIAETALNGTGVYDAVELLAAIPYVDASRIGVTGHSNGARADNWAVGQDNAKEVPLIAAVLLVDNEAFYTDPANDDAYYNLYGSRDVGLVADKYDEFFFRTRGPDGSVLTPPREFATTPNAQSFLNFGADPSTLTETRSVDTFYQQKVDGKDTVRILYTPAETHPWGTISKETVGNAVDFFEATLGAPNPSPGGNQVWQVKEAFTTLGLIAFGIFVVAFTRAMLATPAFAGLRVAKPIAAKPATRAGLGWFWGAASVSALFSGWSYVWFSKQDQLYGTIFNYEPSYFEQGAVYFIGMWAAMNGVFAIVVMTLFYFLFGKKNGFSLRENGVLPGWKALGNSVLLSLVVVAGSFTLVFAVDYFFKTDFRFWTFAIKYFPPDKIGYALLTVPLFLLYFVANSVAINSFNRLTLRGKEWINTAVLALFNSLAAIVLVVAQYTTFSRTGELIDGFGGIFSIWLFPVIVILAAVAVISRKIYRETNNPYIAGFVNAMIVTLISASNTLVTTF